MVRFEGNDSSRVEIFFLLMDLYEQETFPFARNLSRRSLSSRLRRWREVTEVLRLGFKHKVLKRPFSVHELYPISQRDHGEQRR